MEALHPAAVPDDIVAQLQVIMVARRFIAETAIKQLTSLSFYVISLSLAPGEFLLTGETTDRQYVLPTNLYNPSPTNSRISSRGAMCNGTI